LEAEGFFEIVAILIIAWPEPSHRRQIRNLGKTSDGKVSQDRIDAIFDTVHRNKEKM
jgi:hypothetical protein